MKKFCMSISRQFGSLGRPVARILSELLGVEYYDRDIVEMVSKKLNLPVEVISGLEETAATGWAKMKEPLGSGNREIQDRIFTIQSQLIREIAEKESCIIVGRCSDSVLEDFENHISVYIYAPYEDRVINCVNELGMTPKQAKKMLAEIDNARMAYHMRYAKYAPADPDHMDIMVNSAFLGVEGTAKFLASVVETAYKKTEAEKIGI
ncbi:AAA family ATPase [Scatolibacter rhodanostii]|uniref:cytidylate kinase-like family protein n=1 Tax=Scatolibacter rhodanostii TaxID=2014781 RepID=UPI000C07EFFE|nr:cytidylate kinase-like family protein [Scatolibacter rhodanostii]